MILTDSSDLEHARVVVAGENALDEFRQLVRDNQINWTPIPRSDLPEEADPDCVGYQGTGHGYVATLFQSPNPHETAGMIAGGSQGFLAVVVPKPIVEELIRHIQSQSPAA